MRGSLILVAILLAITVASAQPASGTEHNHKPEYLKIEGWQNCVAEESHGSWTSHCLPASRPAGCTYVAWSRLNRLSGPEAVPRCKTY